jgi:hypothetical protein
MASAANSKALKHNMLLLGVFTQDIASSATATA